MVRILTDASQDEFIESFAKPALNVPQKYNAGV